MGDMLENMFQSTAIIERTVCLLGAPSAQMPTKTLKLDATTQIVDSTQYMQAVCISPVEQGRYWHVVPPTLGQENRDVEIKTVVSDEDSLRGWISHGRRGARPVVRGVGHLSHGH